MDRSAVERLLGDWDEVADRAQPPTIAPRPLTVHPVLNGVRLMPLIVAALAVAAGVAWLGVRTGGVGGQGPSSDSSLLTAPPTSATSSAAPGSPTPTASAAEPSPSATVTRPCDPGRLVVAITGWEGAAGSRIATLTLRLVGADPCTIDTLWRPELVDGAGRIRIEGDTVRDVGTIDLQPGETLTTLARASNDCKPRPTPPVTIAFVLGDGSRVVAAPPSPSDVTTAPCNGPGQPGTISMQPWQR